ncbi:glucose-1-phosphate thymidylyltransferase [Actinoallomurus sp. CA-150999]|uniref:glucose-1-phosphate thymidylyltransferase n=1 Tax=Actinoallomurus sp. CA-150999 TaxID=3239887 RepID=UPI003D8D9924
MKALVLAGGTGSRLRPLTYSIPKQLVPVANKPVLVHGLETIREIGVTEIGMIVGGQGDQIRAALGDGSDLGVKITYIRQDAPLGLAHCVGIARDFLGDDDFVMYLGDNVLDGGIVDAAEEFTTLRPDAAVLVIKVDDPTQYGVAELDTEGRVTALVEKPQNPRSDLALMGVYFFTPAIHESVRRIKPSRRGELEITDAIQDLLDRGLTVTAQQYPGYWKDTGNAEDLLDCNRMLLSATRADVAGDVDEHSIIEGGVVVLPGARIIKSYIEGPAIIGAGTVVSDCHLGPYVSVGGDCALSSTGIADSIVLDGAVIDSVKGIRGSVIGRWAHVRTGDHRLFVGDHARVEVAV